MVTSSAMLSGCGFITDMFSPPETEYNSEENIPEAVYGPPEWFEPEEPSYEPENNYPEDVYGPPEDAY